MKLDLISKKIEVGETKVNAVWTKEMMRDIRKLSGMRPSVNNILRKEVIDRILKSI